ncbi:hypothetical protein L2U69_00990 [Zavarzinia compransoris]|uniref:hypothetical protein n=1 Tax=Zavarzinia marina TaxID=2911065 RepID=UPI001F18A248|nr:hypothetical protein [Zavarzinia marina]MCF4164218.1 hypothetical protein [Zavarzinia marina]
MKYAHSILLGGLMFLLAACMTPTGRDFHRADGGQIEPGRTTEADIRRQFGEPAKAQRFTTPKGQEGGGNVEGSPFDSAMVEGSYVVLSYAFSENVNAAAWRQSSQYWQRSATFMFWEGILIDYHIMSSFPEDSSDFASDRLQAIEKGKTIEAQVESLLGRPAGVAIYPAVRDPGTRVLRYAYGFVTVGTFVSDQALTGKQAEVLIGPDGRVVDYKFSTVAASPNR